MKSITIRPATYQDDFMEIANCLYGTDPYIYPGAFGEDVNRATSAIATLMEIEGGLFYFTNIVVAYEGGELCGVLLCNRGSIHWDLKKSMQAVEDYIPSVENFVYVWENYFSQEVAEPGDDTIKIVACCVMPNHRSKGIGTQLFSWLIQEYPNSTLTLDVLASNNAAISIYEKLGFCIVEKYKGFHMDENQKPDCYNMVRYKLKEKFTKTDLCEMAWYGDGGLTDACIYAMGLANDCHELQTIRFFWDTWLKNQESGDKFISKHNEFMPKILEEINKRKDSADIYWWIYHNIVVPTVWRIEQSWMEKAFLIYSDDVKVLKEIFLETE